MKRADIHTEHINNLILSFLNRTISSTDLKVLKEWIDENEDNKAYFSEIQKIWLISSIYEKKNFDKLKDRAFQQFKDRIAQKNQEQDIYISRPNWNRIFYIAACIIIAFFAGIGVMYFTGNQRLSDQTLSYSVESPRGSKLKLSLPDGTSVWLNADSKLRFPVSFTAERREVYLEGEAYFEVAKDSAREFWVHAGAMDVKVLGTSFNVKAYERLETVATTLVEGSVEVACAGKSFQIVPGEQFVYDKNNRVMDVRMVDTESYVSWKDGYYKFRQTTLEEIMETLSVWYGLNVFYVNESAKQVEFTGKVKRYEDARMLLDKFEQTGDVVFDIKGNNVFITIKQKKPFAREWNSFLVKARGMVWQS